MIKQSRCIQPMFVMFLMLSFCILHLSTVNADTATDTVTISIPEVWAMPSDTMIIPLSISMVTEDQFIFSLQGIINFDGSVVSPIKVSKDHALTEIWGPNPTHNVIGDSLLIAFGGEYPLKGSGAIITVYFEVLPTSSIGQTSPFQFENFFINEGFPYVVLQEAPFTVGEASQIELSDTSYAFGSVAMGESKQWQLSISNQGVADLIIMDIYVDSDEFSYGTTSFPLSLQTDQTQDIEVAFQPLTEESFNARLKITSNDPTQPIAIVKLSGTGFNPTGIEDDFNINQLPEEFRLHQNYPNPFNPDTDIRYQIVNIGSPVSTSLTIYNMLGQEIQTLVNTFQGPGSYSVTWDAKDDSGKSVPSGIYVYRLQAGAFSQSRRMVYVR